MYMDDQRPRTSSSKQHCLHEADDDDDDDAIQYLENTATALGTGEMK